MTNTKTEKLYNIAFVQCYRTRNGKVITTLIKEVVATSNTVNAYKTQMYAKYPGTVRTKQNNMVIFTTSYEGAVEWKMMSVTAHRPSDNTDNTDKQVALIKHRCATQVKNRIRNKCREQDMLDALYRYEVEMKEKCYELYDWFQGRMWVESPSVLYRDYEDWNDVYNFYNKYRLEIENTVGKENL